MLLLNKVIHSYSSGFWLDSCRNIAIPVEFICIPADSSLIPVDSTGIRSFLQECNGKWLVLASTGISRVCWCFLGFPTNVLGIPNFQNGKIQEKNERSKDCRWTPLLYPLSKCYFGYCMSLVSSLSWAKEFVKKTRPKCQRKKISRYVHTESHPCDSPEIV